MPAGIAIPALSVPRGAQGPLFSRVCSPDGHNHPHDFEYPAFEYEYEDEATSSARVQRLDQPCPGQALDGLLLEPSQQRA